jgi:hypothetical protein
MDPVPSIEKPSRELRNFSGIKKELMCSEKFHQEGIPLLVSPLLLRERSLGQIDLARIKKDKMGWIIEIGEVKSSQLGTEVSARWQRARLMGAQKFLSALFGHRSKLFIFSDEDCKGQVY